MPIIDVQGLSKTYRVFQKEPGLRGALTDAFHGNTAALRHDLDGSKGQIALLLLGLMLAHAVVFYPTEVVTAARRPGQGAAADSRRGERAGVRGHDRRRAHRRAPAERVGEAPGRAGADSQDHPGVPSGHDPVPGHGLLRANFFRLRQN